MRFIGLDIHRDFCAIAISENGRVRYAGKVATTPDELEVLAQSLVPDDQVALEATSNALPIARMLARLLAAGMLSGSWLPDDETRAQRRRLARRAQLVRSRTRPRTRSTRSWSAPRGC